MVATPLKKETVTYIETSIYNFPTKTIDRGSDKYKVNTEQLHKRKIVPGAFARRSPAFFPGLFALSSHEHRRSTDPRICSSGEWAYSYFIRRPTKQWSYYTNKKSGTTAVEPS